MELTEDKRFLDRLTDLSDEADRSGYFTFSDFLDDHERSLLSTAEGRLSSSADVFGGFPEAERKIAVFFPPHLKEYVEEEVWQEIGIINIIPADERFLKRPLGHRDYLGAILGTGIKREKTGDILLGEKGAYVIVKRALIPYLMENITSVGAATVLVREAQKEELPPPEKGEELVVSVSSMRLDCLVARGFNLSRQEAAKWITQGLAGLNGTPNTDADKPVKVGDKISLRGKGRIILREEKGLSKSGRLQIKIERFTGKDKARA